VTDVFLAGPDRLLPYLLVAAVLFGLGVASVASRRNAVGYLMGIELMLNAANLDFVAYGRFRGPEPAAEAQLAALFVIALAAAEAAVALALVYAVFRNFRDVDLDKIRTLNGD
jgi:NADH:ubiquinone oxidoreductase subunit K